MLVQTCSFQDGKTNYTTFINLFLAHLILEPVLMRQTTISITTGLTISLQVIRPLLLQHQLDAVSGTHAGAVGLINASVTHYLHQLGVSLLNVELISMDVRTAVGHPSPHASIDFGGVEVVMPQRSPETVGPTHTVLGGVIQAIVGVVHARGAHGVAGGDAAHGGARVCTISSSDATKAMT